MHKRKTMDVYYIQSCYDGVWEDEYPAFTTREAQNLLKECRSNNPSILYRIHKIKEKI